MECLRLLYVCVCLLLGHSIGHPSYEVHAEDTDGMTGLLLARIRNLEKRIDLDLKIMKNELKREINLGNRRGKGRILNTQRNG